MTFIFVPGTNRHWCYDRQSDSFFATDSSVTIAELLQSTELGLLGYQATSYVDYARTEIDRDDVVYTLLS